LQEPDVSGEPEPEPAPAKRPRVKAEEPEEELGSRIQCEESDRVPLTYVPCANGILMIGCIAVFAGLDCTVIKLEFDGRRRKAFVSLATVADEEVTMRLPAIQVQLKHENYLKNEVFIFF
jgi:hypothetical protein